MKMLPYLIIEVVAYSEEGRLVPFVKLPETMLKVWVARSRQK